MDIELLNLIYKLNSDLKDDEIYKDFKNKENALNSSDEVKILCYKKDMAIMNYEDALRHFDKSSKEVMETSKTMSKAIYEMSNHPIIKEYNEALKKYNLLLKEIKKEMFGNIHD